MDPLRCDEGLHLGPLLEVTIPKPGNVNRYEDFDNLARL